MTVEEVKKFCSRFMPSYDAYMENLGAKGIEGHVSMERTLNFKLSPAREPVVDGLQLSDESVAGVVEDVLAREGPGRARLLESLKENDDKFEVKNFSPGQDWVINEFRE